MIRRDIQCAYASGNGSIWDSSFLSVVPAEPLLPGWGSCGVSYRREAFQLMRQVGGPLLQRSFSRPLRLSLPSTFLSLVRQGGCDG